METPALFLLLNKWAWFFISGFWPLWLLVFLYWLYTIITIWISMNKAKIELQKKIGEALIISNNSIVDILDELKRLLERR